MATSDVTLAQDGGPASVKLHPYLVALMRWCVSCLWSASTVLLHRLMTAPLPQITASKPAVKPRPASTDHLHPEPIVECVVLHQPQVHNMDIIFVHGLYGSLGNTWRQGDWRYKYKLEPNIIPLRRSKPTQNTINDVNTTEQTFHSSYNINKNICDSYDKTDLDLSVNDINNIYTEQIYTNNLMDQVEVVDNYETQVEFVKDLFKYENQRCDMKCDDKNNYNRESNLKCDRFGCGFNLDNKRDSLCNNRYGFGNTKSDLVKNDLVNVCECKLNNRTCDPGCGCICDECYSPCWPRDWIKEDYPDARVISINYTSDPYLWRPLWKKGYKRSRLPQRAEEMSEQLVALGVGQRPLVWVAHSKGGLFVKQIYCQGYEAHKRLSNEQTDAPTTTTNTEDSRTSEQCSARTKNNTLNDDICNEIHQTENLEKARSNSEARRSPAGELNETPDSDADLSDIELKSSITDEERAALWSSSRGFMFYSVPHLGSPLADIRAPLTARSVELLEICKDSAPVVSLQERWLAAAAQARPAVRSLVETCRTLMAVLYLRIVSVDSADAGVGSLCGVGVVDHREVCKPSSRRCALYTHLMELVRAARDRGRCP